MQAFEHRACSRCAVDRETPKNRTADEDGTGAKRQRLDNIGATPNSAVAEHFTATGRRFDHFGQGLDPGADTVELAAAVI